METLAPNSIPIPDAPASRGAVRSQHQAIVVVERRMGRAADPKGGEQTAPGWCWVLGNAKIGELFDQLFAEAHLTWSSMVVPEEQQATFRQYCTPIASPQSFVPYDGRLQINRNSLTTTPDDGEPLYLIFNGHRFPICDLNNAIEIHRQNRCDATLIDFPKGRKRDYDEKFQIDGEGRVKRVNRSYGREKETMHADRDWPVLMVMSAEAMKVMMDVSLPHRMSQWPGAMLRAGLHLRGSTIPGRSFSLHDREHLFELNEAILRNEPQWLARAGGLEDQGQKVWVGKNVRIDSSANVIGPVIIGDDVEIGKDAVIVGPTTIGRGAKIGAGIILKRAVVLPRTTLASASLKNHTLSHAIVLGEDTPTVQAITGDSEAPDGEGDSPDYQAVSYYRPIKLEKVLESQMPALSGFQYRAFRWGKRLIDIAGSLVALMILLALLPVIALAITINSPGAIFYGAVRQGRGGKNFRCWKIRTMVPNAEESQAKLRSKNEVDGPQFKMKDDPRIFRVGRILRRLNLDELPQFWNVLIGQMSIVGPRPSPEKENQMCPAWREARLSVRPGITGLWQVSRKRDRDDTDFQEWIYYDVQYIKKQSSWLDIRIMFRTLWVAMGGGQ